MIKRGDWFINNNRWLNVSLSDITFKPFDFDMLEMIEIYSFNTKKYKNEVKVMPVTKGRLTNLGKNKLLNILFGIDTSS